ncbi:MAG: hypothetical protein M3Y33_14615 [Actinomycetota bacterium]|nr:hypothetical protein [Actinomycetota bacterium]
MSTSSFTPDELRAAAEVHNELGPDYRDAVLESFLDKVGKEIDARVDARLNGPRQYPLQPAQIQATPPPTVPRQARDKGFALAIVSMALGIPLTAIVAGLNHQGSVGGEFAILLVVWAAIAVINVVYARHKD